MKFANLSNLAWRNLGRRKLRTALTIGGVAVAVLLLVGGGLYSLGAVIYATRWPNPFPRVLGFHEIFHLLVVAAAATQFVAVSLVVM